MNLFTSLRYLVALHQHRHFGRAADACHVTQPALSNAIRALEVEFGTAIVKRGRTFESFTPEGEQIFVTAQRMLREHEQLQQALRSSEEHPCGMLTLGAVPSVMPIAARFAGMLQHQFPRISIAVRSLSSGEIEAGLEQLSLDMALGYTERLQNKANRISTLHQYTERYFLLRRTESAGPSGLQLANQPTTWAAASQRPLCLLTPEMHNRTIVDEAFGHAGVTATPAIETDSILTLGLSVLTGDICSVLPGALVDVLRGYPQLEAVPLVEPEVRTPIGFMFASTERPSRTLRAALAVAADPAWHDHVRAHSGLLQSSTPVPAA